MSRSDLKVGQLIRRGRLVDGAVDPDADVAAAGTGEAHVLDALEGRLRRVGELDDPKVRRKWRAAHTDCQDAADAFLVLVDDPVADETVFHSRDVLRKNNFKMESCFKLVSFLKNDSFSLGWKMQFPKPELNNSGGKFCILPDVSKSQN